MNNGWLKVAMISFVGVIFSIFALAIVGNMVPLSNQNDMSHQMSPSASQHSQTPQMQYIQQPTPYFPQGYSPYQAHLNETLLLKTQIYELRLKVMQMQYLLQQQQIQNNNTPPPASSNSANMGMGMM